MKYPNPIPRVFYVGMIVTDAYGMAIRESIYSGAATRKIISVCDAMRRAGLRTVIVSLPFVGGHAKKTAFPAIVIPEARVPAVFLPTLRSSHLRKLFTPAALFSFVWRHVRQQDTVILYNHAVEYLPALVALRFKGVKVVQDIEDAPTEEEKGLRGLINRISFWATFKLTSPLKMVVADHVARELNLQDYVAIRGVATAGSGEGRIPEKGKWKALVNGAELKVHFGGTLIPETGIDLFCAVVEYLAGVQDQLACPVAFMVTGVGELEKARDVSRRIQDLGKIRVEVLSGLTSSEYRALIETCHASLSLKRPGSGMSNTTFPSKVIEITGSAVALVSTRISDVPAIFNGDSAYFLDDYTAESLANIILAMTNEPGRVHQIARSGFETCHRVFSPESVGSEMKRLI